MMPTLTVDIVDELRDFIDSLVKSGDYRTQSEGCAGGLRLLKESRQNHTYSLYRLKLSVVANQCHGKNVFLQKMKTRAPDESKRADPESKTVP